MIRLLQLTDAAADADAADATAAAAMSVPLWLQPLRGPTAHCVCALHSLGGALCDDVNETRRKAGQKVGETASIPRPAESRNGSVGERKRARDGWVFGSDGEEWYDCEASDSAQGDDRQGWMVATEGAAARRCNASDGTCGVKVTTEGHYSIHLSETAGARRNGEYRGTGGQVGRRWTRQGVRARIAMINGRT